MLNWFVSRPAILLIVLQVNIKLLIIPYSVNAHFKCDTQETSKIALKQKPRYALIKYPKSEQ